MVLIQEDAFRENTISSQRLTALCTTKSRQRQNIYSVVNSGQHQDFSFDMEFCWALSSLVYLYTIILRCTSRSYSKLGPLFPIYIFLVSPEVIFLLSFNKLGAQEMCFLFVVVSSIFKCLPFKSCLFHRQHLA